MRVVRLQAGPPIPALRTASSDRTRSRMSLCIDHVIAPPPLTYSSRLEERGVWRATTTPAISGWTRPPGWCRSPHRQGWPRWTCWVDSAVTYKLRQVRLCPSGPTKGSTLILPDQLHDPFSDLRQRAWPPAAGHVRVRVKCATAAQCRLYGIQACATPWPRLTTRHCLRNVRGDGVWRGGGF